MVKRIIQVPANLPFSKAIVHNQEFTMELSGQIGLNSEGKLEEGIEKQTSRAIENVKEVLGSVGWDLSNLVKVRIFLTSMENYSIINEIYSKCFTSEFPTRVVLAVKELPLGALIEIDATACGDKIKE